MKFSTTLALAVSLISSASTACLLPSDAKTLSTNFGKLISAYSEALANQTMTADFVDYSESVNTLINSGGSAPQALLGPTFTSRANFEAGSAAQPAVPFTIKNMWYNCDTITVHWESDQSPQPVVGISVLHTRLTLNFKNPSLWQIDQVWAEFDSGAWLVNLGVLKPSSKAKREIAFQA